MIFCCWLIIFACLNARCFFLSYLVVFVSGLIFAFCFEILNEFELNQSVSMVQWSSCHLQLCTRHFFVWQWLKVTSFPVVLLQALVQLVKNQTMKIQMKMKIVLVHHFHLMSIFYCLCDKFLCLILNLIQIINYLFHETKIRSWWYS